MLIDKLNKLDSQITATFTTWKIHKSFNMNSIQEVIEAFGVRGDTIVINYRSPIVQSTENYNNIASGIELMIYIMNKNTTKDTYNTDLLTAFETFKSNVNCKIIGIESGSVDNNTNYTILHINI